MIRPAMARVPDGSPRPGYTVRQPRAPPGNGLGPATARAVHGFADAAVLAGRLATHIQTHTPKGTDMDSNDRIADFLSAVDELRANDETVRSTAHTSSVSDEGWLTTEEEQADA